eukprot:5698605-Amphidinium_carterae.2
MSDDDDDADHDGDGRDDNGGGCVKIGSFLGGEETQNAYKTPMSSILASQVRIYIYMGLDYIDHRSGYTSTFAGPSQDLHLLNLLTPTTHK